MGSFFNKDPHLFIYITLSKRFYYAGETVEGAVHVDCKANRPYKQLCLRIHGSEKIYWSENDNFKDTYLELLPLAQFQSGISTGQYTFPFAFLLPSTLPASVQLQWHNYIRYTLTAYFPAQDPNATVPQFKRPLHIREPPRTIKKGFKLQALALAHAKFCCCCWGQADLTFESSAAALMYNETFLVRGTVDNTRGTTDINSFKVVLSQTIKKISKWGSENQTNQFILYECPNAVPIGTSLPFDVQIKVPTEALGYTAIGSIVYRAYFLQLVANINCCYSNPRVSKHIIFNTSVPPLVDEEELKEELKEAPEVWNPIVQPPVSFLNLKPYIYIPSPLIDVRNQLGLPNQAINQNIPSMEMHMNPPSANRLLD